MTRSLPSDSNRFTHDPQAVLDYHVDWSRWLAAVDDNIETSTWTVPDGIEEATPAPSEEFGVTTIWLTGGSAGTPYEITNHITTVGGREDDRTIELRVAHR